MSERAHTPYTLGNRGLWLKVKCLDREEFVVIGCGARPFLGALLLGYYDPDGRLIFAGSVGSASTRRNCSGYDEGCSRLRPTRCCSRCRRPAAAASDRRSCSAAYIGSGPSWWLR